MKTAGQVAFEAFDKALRQPVIETWDEVAERHREAWEAAANAASEHVQRSEAATVRAALDEVGKLKAEIAQLKKERDAWIRLVKAERSLRLIEERDEGGHAAHAAREELDSAQHALQRLGVDTDALIGSAWSVR